MQHLKRMIPFLGLAFFLAALVLLEHSLRHVSIHDIRSALHSVPRSRILAAFGAVAVSYALLGLYDVLGLLYVGSRQPLHRAVLISFTASALSNNVGYSVLSGGAVRFHYFSKWGLNALEIARVVAFSTLTAWLGLATLGGSAFLLDATTVSDVLGMPHAIILLTGVLLLGVPTVYVTATLLWKRPVLIRGTVFTLPALRLGLSQILIACLDLSAAATVIYFLLPEKVAISWFAFVALYVCAVIAGVISQVPGGLGVFETSFLLFLKPYAAAEDLVAVLVLYRVLYYLAPLAVAVLSIGLYEGRARLKPALGTGNRILGPVIPDLLALSVLVSGCMLLVSGAVPPIPHRLHLLRDALPVPAVEFSHFSASIIGLLLTILAWSLHRRVNAAFWAGAVLLVSGAVFSLMKGLDYEEATILILVLAVLLLSRRYFTRRASLLRPRFNRAWIGTVLMVVAGFVWLGLFSHKHVEYRHELWWQITLDSDVPRFLRAAVSVAAIGIAFGVAGLLRPFHRRPTQPTEAVMNRVKDIVAQSPHTSANLALLDDKAFMFNDDNSAFIMYAVEGNSWVAMGDPVGPDSALEELVWKFREVCNRGGGWPVFYQIRPDRIPTYLDAGLQLFKLGEEATVDLTAFSLDGSRRKDERHTLHKLERDGLTFTVIPRESVPHSLNALRQVSDEWLDNKSTREKGFSLGCFRDPYIVKFPCATVERNGKILAFANLWQSAGNEELSVDLMRYRNQAPSGIMDYLFLSTMLWGKEAGFRLFNLGMAPLAGLETRSLAPLWNRVGGLIFRYGEHFYNFRGLRQYKEKFDPEWRPMYLASPGGLALPTILTNITTLVSGRVIGVLKK